ncbi:MAG TPA: hypothetical protein VNA57_06880 [Acidimicrobiales bacterium]|nr:hypothetical protein [Acidimicrobiales bacterium]
MRRSTRCLAALGLMALMAQGACGGDDDTPSAGSTSASGTGSGSESKEAAHDEHADHGSDEEAAFPLDEADITVKVSMKDFAFAGLPPAIKGEQVLFEVTNDGPSEHEFVVFEDSGADAVRGIRPFARSKTQMLAVELKPGAYTARCLVKLGDQTHADLGMQTDFTVE